MSWIVHSVLIGICAGIGALAFGVVLHSATHFTLHSLMGLSLPGDFQATPAHAVVPLWIVVLPALGGLISGLLCDRFAPEAMGHGTDGAIQAFHEKEGLVRPAVPPVKLIATLFTLGLGGAGGAEGPVAQIGSGVGSMLGRWLDLGPRRTRILLVAGMAAGVGALFEAPLAAMIFAGEILYRGSDIDGEVLVPSAIASVVAYSTYVGGMGWIHGAVRWSHMFTVPAWTFTSGFELFGYTLLALACGLFARLWIRVFYGIHSLFDALPIPRFSKPALGGLLTGLLAFAMLRGGSHGLAPAVLGGGYGYLQLALEAKITLAFALQLFALKMLATSFSIGSGGSGGVFGPSLVLGGMVGAAVGHGLHAIHPQLVVDPGTYAMVGMAALFGAAAHAPICSVIMVSEITKSYGLLVPSIWVCVLAFLLVGKESLYAKQVLHLEDSPAHQLEMRWNILENLSCGDWMTKNPVYVSETDSFEQMERVLLRNRSLHKFPVLDSEGSVVGVLSLGQIREFFRDPDIREVAIARDAMDSEETNISSQTTLGQALAHLDRLSGDLLTVVDHTKNGKLMGILTRRDILLAYNHEMTRRNQTWEEF